jgi:hypothetical protein
MDLMTEKAKTQDTLARRVKLRDNLETPFAQMLFDEENLSGTLTSYLSSKDTVLMTSQRVSVSSEL